MRCYNMRCYSITEWDGVQTIDTHCSHGSHHQQFDRRILELQEVKLQNKELYPHLKFTNV